MCVSRHRPPTCLCLRLWPDGSPKFITIVLSVHQIVAPGIVEMTVVEKANQTQPRKNQQLYFEMKLFLSKGFFSTLSFSVHQIVHPGIVEITLFKKANQTQLLHNSTLKMKPFFSISYQNVYLAHFRGFVAFVVLWFGLSKFQNLTVHASIVRFQYEELSVHMPFEAAQALSVVRCRYE